jgi:hypothetical protein
MHYEIDLVDHEESDFFKVHFKVIELLKDGKISCGAFGLYSLLISNSKKFTPSRPWILNKGFKKTYLLKLEKELEDLGLVKINRGIGGRSFTTYYALDYDDLCDQRFFEDFND